MVLTIPLIKKNEFLLKMKKILILFIFCLLTNKVYSQELLKTLSDAFKNNSKLNAEREGLNASKQDVNISIGEFLPSITLSGDMATQKDVDRNNKSGASLQDTHSEPKSQSVVIEQKIFDGFTNYNDVKKSKLELRYAQIKLNKLEQEVLLDAAKAYYGLGYSVKNLEFNRSNLDLLERQVETDRSRLDRGEISLTDLAQSESSLAGASAKFITAKNELVSGKKNFQKIIGLKAPEKMDLDFFPGLKIPNSLQEAITISKQKNPSLNLARIDFEIAKKDLLIAKGDLAPSAKLSYSLKKNEDLSASVDEREQEEVKATITWPIFDGGKNLSSVKKAKFKMKQKQFILDDIFNQIQIETANAWTTYNSSKGVLDATEAQLKAAEIANEGITLEYETGNKRTTLEVIQSRTLLLDARTSYAKAQRDFAIAQFNLLASIGDLHLDNIR
jgi:outer membrane protein